MSPIGLVRRGGRGVRGAAWVAALAGVAAVAAVAASPGRAPAPARAAPARIATFNIEEFPRDERQVDGAFALIAGLDAQAIAVQEIFDPARFAEAARRRLGARWRFASADATPAGVATRIFLGVLYDGDVYALAAARLHDDTRVDGRGKPAFEVVLRPRAGGPDLRLLVVHLKSGTAWRPLRARQLAALDRLVRAERRRPGRLVVLGDFNATEEADRADLAAIARDADLAWATRDVPCTAFWRRADACPTSRLDHVLTSSAPAAVEVGGACATEGCAARDRCPLYREQISDHCPVTVTLP